MRIVGGRLRGRKLAVPKSQDIRPTADRVRESLFNILEHNHAEDLAGAEVLDIFAGTGALGIEAFSRGAASVIFMETGSEALGLLRQNVEALGLAEHADILKRDATRPGKRGIVAPRNLVLADPPYGKGLAEKALKALIEKGWLAPDALIVLEENKASLPAFLDGFTTLERRQFGGTSIGIYRYRANSDTRSDE